MSKERLVEVLLQTETYTEDFAVAAKIIAEHKADQIIADGWIRQPCKVGDTVYQINRKRICEGTVVSIHQNLVGTEPGRWIVTVWFDDYYANSREAGFECGTHLFFPFDCFEKDVFLKREKAEAKLKEDKND